MEKTRRRSANVKAFLGTTPIVSTQDLTFQKQHVIRNDPQEGPLNRRVAIPSLRRSNPTRFSKLNDADETKDKQRMEDAPPSPGSSITSHSSITEEECDLSNIHSSQNEATIKGISGRPLSESEDRNRRTSERSLSSDDSTLTTATGMDSSRNGDEPFSRAQESASILDFMENLDNVDDSYMLSVFWNSGDCMTTKEDLNISVAGNTKCSYASHSSNSSTMTSTSSYTWLSSTRQRHKGAHTKRVVKGVPIASWLDTMEESSTLLLGPLNNWSATRGWKSGETPKWDPKPNLSAWETLDPVFDMKSYKNESNVDWSSVVE